MAMSWVDELKRYVEAGVAHTFLLHLNVGDYVHDGKDAEGKTRWMTLRQYIREALFVEPRKLLMFYDRSQGITFAGKTLEEVTWAEKFCKALNKYGKNDALPTSPGQALPFIERVLTASPQEQKDLAGETLEPGNIAVMIGFAETVVPNGDVGKLPDTDRTNVVTLARWVRSQSIFESGALIFLCTLNWADIAPLVRGDQSDVVQIKIPFPNHETRVAFLEHLRERHGEQFKLADGTTLQTISNVASGLTLRALEDAVKLAVHDERPIDEDLVFDKKKELIESLSGGILRVVRPKWKFEDIGGLHELKADLLEIAKAMRNGDVLSVPEGVTLMGPPGTAKTVLCEAFASETSIPMLDMVGVRDMWVGSSEQRQELAFTLIDELAPNIIRRDEAEAEDKRRTGADLDSGVNQRLQKREFEFFSDPRRRGRVLLFRLTNRPDLMDPASLRAGRSDFRAPVLPNPDDLPEIIDRIARSLSRQISEAGQKLDWQVTGKDVHAKHMAAFAKYTGADVRAFLAEAGKFARRNGRDAVTMDDIDLAVADYLPTKNEKEYRDMIALALSFTTLRHLIPKAWQERMKEEGAQTIIDVWKQRGGEIPKA